LNSSAAAALSSGFQRTALGYAEASDALGPSGGAFDGVTVDGSAVLVRYTFYGDTNLDGHVDIADLGNFATHWQTSGEWIEGDFDYNGFIDIMDLGALATNWQAGVSITSGSRPFAEALASVGMRGSSLPEPTLPTWVVFVGACASQLRSCLRRPLRSRRQLYLHWSPIPARRAAAITRRSAPRAIRVANRDR
jgi:hypothetical protein